MKRQGQTPDEQDTRKAAEYMKRAVDKTVEHEKSRDRFGNDRGKNDAAHDLKKNAEKDTGKSAS